MPGEIRSGPELKMFLKEISFIFFHCLLTFIYLFFTSCKFKKQVITYENPGYLKFYNWLS